MKQLAIIKNNFLKIEDTYSPNATKSSEAVRFHPIDDDIRAPFFRDVDRIIHALSYTRYADKTQVYSFKQNDHISERMLHVQLVSKVARTIGRALNLNCDLIEAIALGHDVGHTPLGHTGEALLNEISLRELGEYFAHNIQGVRHYMEVENHGEGLNLSVQVLDGIMCHNGEMLSNVYTPVAKTKEEFLREYDRNEILNEFNLEKNKKTFLIFGGGEYGMSNIKGFFSALLNVNEDIQIVAVAGKSAKNQKLFEELAKASNKRVTVLGYTNKD